VARPRRAGTRPRRARAFPPLVFAGETRRLADSLGRVADRRAFVLQAGDCAESFSEINADAIRDKLKVILQMAVVLTYGTGVPVVKIGRIAGQFAKPARRRPNRAATAEIPSFRGHIVHDDAPNLVARRANPSRMIEAYRLSAATLNLVRTFTKGGFARARAGARLEPGVRRDEPRGPPLRGDG